MKIFIKIYSCIGLLLTMSHANESQFKTLSVFGKVGEGVVTSLLRDRFKEPITKTHGNNSYTIEVEEIYVDFEEYDSKFYTYFSLKYNEYGKWYTPSVELENAVDAVKATINIENCEIQFNLTNSFKDEVPVWIQQSVLNLLNAPISLGNQSACKEYKSERQIMDEAPIYMGPEVNVFADFRKDYLELELANEAEFDKPHLNVSWETLSCNGVCSEKNANYVTKVYVKSNVEYLIKSMHLVNKYREHKFEFKGPIPVYYWVNRKDKHKIISHNIGDAKKIISNDDNNWISESKYYSKKKFSFESFVVEADVGRNIIITKKGG